MRAAERKRVLAEAEWWRSLAAELGMRLYGFNGMPPSSASFYDKDNKVVEVPGSLAQAIYDRIEALKR